LRGVPRRTGARGGAMTDKFMDEREAMRRLLTLWQRIIDDNPKASSETHRAEFVREAMADPDLQHVRLDLLATQWIKDLEAKLKLH
jgi:hypothetical protein